MALSFHLLPPKLLPQQPIKSKTHHFSSTISLTNPPKVQISCTKKSLTDSDLASDLAAEVQKLNTHVVQTQEAMKKSRELLFTELCQHMGLKSEEVKKKWKRMSEEEKWGLVKEFVSEWGVDFHPLSTRGVKEMVDEHLVEDEDFTDSSASGLFPGLNKMMGF